VALLPGSRPNEIHRILPPLVEATPRIARAVPGVQFVVARAPSLDRRLFGPLDGRPAGAPPIVLAENADAVLGSADVVVTASGTATVQTALHDRPMVIVYRVSPLTYAIGRSVVNLSTFGMVNLIAGRPVVPELIQGALTPDAVAREAVSLLTDRTRVETMRRDLADVRRRLGGRGASERAATAIRAVCDRAVRTTTHP
jgi:lipid-A-disaccharide synthase